MTGHLALAIAVGIGPVVLFLLGLVYLDSFKLVSIGTVFVVMLLGGCAAVASYLVSGPAMDALHLDYPHYSRYLGPVVEESFKASIMLYLFARNRIGFMIDAAVLGVAVGCGFSVFENGYYSYVFPEANAGIWIVRGFGTAIMHAGTAAIFGVTAQNLSERQAAFKPLNYLPGFLLAISMHSIFNQFGDWPLTSAVVTVFAVPFVLLMVFDKSEHEAHEWLIHDYETHEHLLADIESGAFTHSEAGRFVTDLAAKFDKADVSTIFEYIRLHTQLVLRAETLLLAREQGTPLPAASTDRDELVRLHELERETGKTALLAIWPHLKFSRRELWELHRLEARIIAHG